MLCLPCDSSFRSSSHDERMSSNLIAVETGLQELHPSNPQTTLGVLVLCFLLPFLKSRPTVEENDGLFYCILRNVPQQRSIYRAHVCGIRHLCVFISLYGLFFRNRNCHLRPSARRLTYLCLRRRQRRGHPRPIRCVLRYRSWRLLREHRCVRHRVLPRQQDL